MKHPDREEWIPFVFDEADPENHQRLADHLGACPDCAREIAAWRRSLARLDSWPAPQAQRRGPILFPPLIKWALAAMVILGIGFLAGRGAAGASIRTAELSAQVEASVRASLQNEIEQVAARVEAQRVSDFAALEARRNNDATVEAQRIWRRAIEMLSNARAEDARRVEGLFAQLQDRHEAELVALRKDLETLASMTDEEIRQARMTLVQLSDNQKNID